MKPKRITIGLIAPSGQVLDHDALDLAVTNLRGLGFKVVAPALLKRRYQRFADTDEKRLAALNAMAARADLQVLMAVRGSYGLSRLIDKIDLKKLAASKKLLVGYSDFTLLTVAAWAKAGARTAAGPMACPDFGVERPNDFMLASFSALLAGEAQQFTQADAAHADPRFSQGAAIKGPVWGGNLAMITHLAGTPYLPRARGGILVIEDINEHPYRVERMIYQLRASGVLQRQKALVLGDFSGYRLGANDNGYDFNAMLEHLRNVLTIPVVSGFPLGHGEEKASFRLGAPGVLTLDGSGYSLKIGG